MGGVGEDSINTIRAIGDAISQRVNSQYSSSKQLSVLWGGNACLWLHREHAPPPRWMASFIFYPLYTCSLHVYYFYFYLVYLQALEVTSRGTVVLLKHAPSEQNVNNNYCLLGKPIWTINMFSKHRRNVRSLIHYVKEKSVLKFT